MASNELTFAAMQDDVHSSKSEKMYRLGIAALLAERGVVLKYIAPNTNLEYEAVDGAVSWADGSRDGLVLPRKYYIVYQHIRATDTSRLEISQEQYQMLTKLRFSEYYNGGKLTPGTSIHGGGYITPVSGTYTITNQFSETLRTTQRQIQYLQDNITKFYK